MTPKEIKQQFEQIENERSAVELDWREAEKYCYPQAANSESPKTDPINKQDRWELVDSTGIEDTLKLSKALVSFIVPPNLPWVGFDIQSGGKSVFTSEDDDPSDERKAWITDVSKRVQWEFDQSNFGRETSLAFRSTVVYGICGLLFQEYFDMARERKQFHFTSLSPWEIYPIENEWGIIDSNFRKYKMSAENILKKWPKAEYDDKFKEAAKKNPFEYHDIIHVVKPNNNSDGKRFSSESILHGKEYHLESEQSAFYTNPYIIARYERLRNKVYGNSPAIDALPFLRTLNNSVRLQMASYDSLVNGKWVHEEGSIIDGELDFSSSVSHAMTDVNAIKNLAEHTGIQVSEMLISKKREEIDRMLGMEDIEMPAPQASPATAFEHAKRIEQQLRQHAPLYGAIRTEFLSPLVERALDILRRRKDGSEIKEFPADLSNPNEELIAVFKGPLAKSQQIVRSQASDGIVGELISIISQAPALLEIEPKLAFLINYHKYFSDKADAHGVDPHIFNKKLIVDMKVKELQEAKQAQADAELAATAAKAAKDGAQAFEQGAVQ